MPILLCLVHLPSQRMSAFFPLLPTTHCQMRLLFYTSVKPKSHLTFLLPSSHQQYFFYYIHYFLPHVCQAFSLNHSFISLYIHTKSVPDCPEKNLILFGSLPHSLRELKISVCVR